MRRMLAVATAAVLALAMTVPIASAQEGWVNDITITQATVVQKTGEVHLTGYAYCSGLDYAWLDVQGQLKQAMGRKTTIQGGVWGGIQCVPNGPAYFDLWSTADWGTFGTGWGTVNFGFGWNNCNEGGCWWEDHGGIDWTVVKIVKK